VQIACLLIPNAADHLSRFPEFPFEIKEQIYEYAMRNDGCFNIPLRTDFRTGIPSLPGICLTSKLERSIAALVLARNTILRLSHKDRVRFMRWLNSIGFPKSKFMTALKKIQLMYSDNSFVANLFFASTLPVLVDLTITIEMGRLVGIDRERDLRDDNVYSDWNFPNDKDVKAAIPSQVLNTFGLSQIGGCKALSRLTFQIPDFVRIYEIGWLEYWNVDHVAKVCQEIFMEGNGRALDVEMTCDYKGRSRRLKVGKVSEELGGATWTRITEGLACDGVEALH
jgi:hypothetical protein